VKPWLLLAAGLFLVFGLPPMPTLPVWTHPEPVAPVAPAAATAAVYVYEKGETPVPAGVSVGLNQLNRERHVVATLFEQDTTDGGGEVPDQYRPAVDAAKAKGLPSLVVLSGSTVLSIVKAPTTAEEIVRAVP
jgi:hypothetical protein